MTIAYPHCRYRQWRCLSRSAAAASFCAAGSGLVVVVGF